MIPPVQAPARPSGASGPEGPLDIRHVVIADTGGYPSASNGVHQVARSLALEQARAGDAPRIVFVSNEPGGFSGPPGIRLDHVPLAGPTLRGRPVTLAPASREALLAGAGPRTVFHLHGARQPLLVGLTRHLRARGLPYIITLHSCFSHLFDRDGRVKKPLVALYVTLMERAALQGARFVHVLTDLEEAELGRLAPRARARLIPNGAFSSSGSGRPPPPDRAGPRRGEPVFGFCGRLAVFHKGLDLLVDGFALHCRRGGRGRLVLMGPRADDEDLAARAAALGIADRVTVLEPRYGAERDAVVRDWDFFAIPSRLDHWPTAALEAELLGVPVLVTRETGLHALAVQYGAGLLVPDLTAEQVADTLAEAARIDPARWRQMSAGAYRMACEVADWHVAAARVDALYRGLPEPRAGIPVSLLSPAGLVRPAQCR
ncbi:glycosyltransferase family 4 protein [Methylobacterium oryzisoli]|uniref:glycosyltransferase family 4 protein n=1 Tax=Methylobacterium oryzisoli TaxID=3385502 RepID=UPI0038918B4C